MPGSFDARMMSLLEIRYGEIARRRVALFRDLTGGRHLEGCRNTFSRCQPHSSIPVVRLTRRKDFTSRAWYPASSIQPSRMGLMALLVNPSQHSFKLTPVLSSMVFKLIACNANANTLSQSFRFVSWCSVFEFVSTYLEEFFHLSVLYTTSSYSLLRRISSISSMGSSTMPASMPLKTIDVACWRYSSHPIGEARGPRISSRQIDTTLCLIDPASSNIYSKISRYAAFVNAFLFFFRTTSKLPSMPLKIAPTVSNIKCESHRTQHPSRYETSKIQQVV